MYSIVYYTKYYTCNCNPDYFKIMPRMEFNSSNIKTWYDYEYIAKWLINEQSVHILGILPKPLTIWDKVK